MKNKKTEIKIFTLPDWNKEENYLNHMHRKGWRFTHLSFLFYHFEKCEPEDVVYQLDFNPQGSQNKNEYICMFNDCGWEYLQDFNGYSYFRKQRAEMNGDEKIFCDNESRLEMLKRVFKVKVVPLIFMFLFMIIPYALYHHISPEIKYCYIFLLAVYSGFFLYFAYRYLQFKNSISK